MSRYRRFRPGNVLVHQRGRIVARRENHHEERRRRLRNGSPRRIGRRIAERPFPVGEHRPARDVDCILSDAGVRLPRGSTPNRHITPDRRSIVEADGKEEGDRAKIADLDRGVHPWERLPLKDPTEEGLGGGTSRGGVHSERPIEASRRGESHDRAGGLPGVGRDQASTKRVDLGDQLAPGGAHADRGGLNDANRQKACDFRAYGQIRHEA